MPKHYQTNLRAFRVYEEAFNVALTSDKPSIMKFPSHAEATVFRHRCNYYRRLVRQNMSAPEIPFEHRGTSAYDDLELVLPRKGERGDNILTIRKRRTPTFEYVDENGNPVAYDEPAPIPGPPMPSPLEALGAVSADNLDLGPTVPEPGETK